MDPETCSQAEAFIFVFTKFCFAFKRLEKEYGKALNSHNLIKL